jgi:hypothetical protein
VIRKALNENKSIINLKYLVIQKDQKVLAKIFKNEIQFGKFPCLGY